MENDYYKRYEPFFGSWYIKEFIGKGSYGKVFEIERKDIFGTVNTGALKAITVPVSEDELEDLLTNGMDRDSASNYFRNYAEGMNREIALMSRLKAHSNIVSYEDHDIQPHEDGLGWDILIRMELLTPITVFQKANKQFTRQQVVHLGIDLCRALELCQRYNIIHRDIKPANIFLSDSEDFKLGDFGVARMASASTGASTRAGTVNYMAPEVFRGEKYTSNVDTYSLGLVMYQLLNANRLPFCPPYPDAMTPDQREQANARRLSGAALPPPANANGQLAEIVLKACAPNPADRYESPLSLRKALEAIQLEDVEEENGDNKDDKPPVPENGGETPPEPQDGVDDETRKLWKEMQDIGGKTVSTEPSPDTGDKTEKVLVEDKPVSEETPEPQLDADEETENVWKKLNEAGGESTSEESVPDEGDKTEKVPVKDEAVDETTPEIVTGETGETQHETEELHNQPKISRRKFLGVLGAVAAVSVAAGGAVMAGRSANQSTSSVSSTASVPTESVADSLEPVVETVPAYTIQYRVYRDLGGNVEGSVSDVFSEKTATMPDKIAVFSDDVVQSYSARAVPDEGYDFLVWSDGRRAEKRSDADVRADFDVFAVFETNEVPNKPTDDDASIDMNWSLKNGNLHITGTGQMPDYGFEEKTATYQDDSYIYLETTSPWRDSSKKIKTITIDSGITSIGSWAFRFCSAQKVEIPESVERIGNDAFSWCESITSIALPEHLVDIGENAFQFCHGLQSIEIPQNIEVIRKDTFFMRDDRNPKLKSVLLPKALKVIAGAAFFGNTALRKIELPEGLVYIGNRAFAECTALTSAAIPASVKYIGDYAFGGCTLLQSVTVSRSCQRGENAFPSTTQINYYD